MKGFALLELLIVFAVIGIIVALAMPAYLGMQDRLKRGAVLRASAAIEPELQAWLNGAFKGNTGLTGAFKEVDSNGDGLIDNTDMNNSQLFSLFLAGTLDDQFVLARQTQHKEMSPWDPNVSLFAAGAASVSLVSQINVAQNGPGEAAFLRVIATDKGGGILHNKSLYAD